MAELPEVEEILRSNPNVDPRELERGRQLLRELREGGARGARYNLASPVTRRRPVVGEEPSKDPRTVDLKRSR